MFTPMGGRGTQGNQPHQVVDLKGLPPKFHRDLTGRPKSPQKVANSKGLSLLFQAWAFHSFIILERLGFLHCWNAWNASKQKWTVSSKCARLERFVYQHVRPGIAATPKTNIIPVVPVLSHQSQDIKLGHGINEPMFHQRYDAKT